MTLRHPVLGTLLGATILAGVLALGGPTAHADQLCTAVIDGICVPIPQVVLDFPGGDRPPDGSDTSAVGLAVDELSQVPISVPEVTVTGTTVLFSPSVLHTCLFPDGRGGWVLVVTLSDCSIKHTTGAVDGT